MKTFLFPLFILLLPLSLSATADIYIYTGKKGDRIITDHKLSLPGYKLTTHRKTVKDVGAIAANRKVKQNSSPLHDKYDNYIHEASSKHGIAASLIKAVIRAESNFNPQAVSHKGAQGLMQLMPNTASIYDVQNSFDPKQNIEAGTKHLKYLMSLYDELKLVIAAYNAGEGAVAKHKGIPPYKETKNYVKKVLAFQKQFDKGL